MIGKVFLGVLSLFLLLGVFRTPFIDGIKGWRTSTVEEDFDVVTVAGQVTANVTLAYDLYQAATAEIILPITSNTTGSPSPSSYTEATKTLLIAGIPASTSQKLTVNYYAETDDPVMQVVGPFLSFFLFFGLAGLIVYGMVKSRKVK